MNKLALDELLRLALREDIGFGDITSETIFAEDHISQGYLLAKENMVLAGIGVFIRVFALLDDRVIVTPHYVDGARIAAGEKIAFIEGPTRALLAGERVAINLLQRMSGIATKTSRYVEALRESNTVIVDTRKTTPGMRMLEKYAVTVGGGKNHRYGLDDMVLIKDNHIHTAGGIVPAVNKVRGRISPFMKIEVEAETFEQVEEALSAGADVIMLDNMTLADIKQAVMLINGQALVEVSGNVTLEKVAALADVGVDIISCGALTHSVKAIDISMKLY
ncbi:putative nicotinate-nucleotide pyrophosphorylase [carboxylating] [Sporomusa carbonis]|uniref:carboxylating nicotinate-nucleotide diphosphorylase n=1 Tax=Sporomusa carbonis TaxID=3076075 RepID=UPI003A6B09FF